MKHLCGKCGSKHRGLVAKTDDAAMIQWLNEVKETNPEEYQKVLAAAEPGPGQRYSKFNLTQYAEARIGRKVRGVREDQEAMQFARYLQYHTTEIQEHDRMTSSECRAAWMRDIQGPDFEKRDVFCRKTGKWEPRDHIWVTTGAKRYKKKEEEDSRQVARIHSSGNGTEAAASAAFARMSNFVCLSGWAGRLFLNHWQVKD